MHESKVDLVKQKRFTVNFPSVGAPMTVRTEGDEVVILMRMAIRPRDDVVNIDIDMSTSGDGAPMPSFNENPTSDISRYLRAVIPT